VRPRDITVPPAVSVILPFFDEERFLADAVRSVVDQQHEDWELILVDDGSTDRSTAIAQELVAHDPRIRYVDHPGHRNRGMSASRNLGAAHSTAPYLAFLDADDVWLPSKLREQLELLAGMPDVAMVVGAQLFWFSWDPQATDVDRTELTGGMADRRLDPPLAALTFSPLGTGATAGVTGLLRRSAFDAVGGFEPQFPGLFEDQAFNFKLYLNYPIHISGRAWSRYRQHDGSCTSTTSRADRVRRKRAFLDFLEAYVGPGGDARVLAAIRRARRALQYRTLAGPGYEVLDRLPEGVQYWLRRLFRRAV
jgi:glycosyltransferase involved in cell wall biosynthesis